MTRCLLDASKRFAPKKQRDDLSSFALHLPLVIGAVRRACSELGQAAAIELNAVATLAAAAGSPSLTPPLAAADAAAAAAAQALVHLLDLMNQTLKIEPQSSSEAAAAAAAASQLAALSLSSPSPLAAADNVVRRLLHLHHTG